MSWLTRVFGKQRANEIQDNVVLLEAKRHSYPCKYGSYTCDVRPGLHKWKRKFYCTNHAKHELKIPVKQKVKL